MPQVRLTWACGPSGKAKKDLTRLPPSLFIKGVNANGNRRQTTSRIPMEIVIPFNQSCRPFYSTFGGHKNHVGVTDGYLTQRGKSQNHTICRALLTVEWRFRSYGD